MHDVDAAGLEFLRAAAAAVHVEDLDFQALLAEETALLRHPEGEHRVHGLGNTDLELGWFGSAVGTGRHRHHHECNDAKAELRPSMIALHLATCPSNTSAFSGSAAARAPWKLRCAFDIGNTAAIGDGVPSC